MHGESGKNLVAVIAVKDVHDDVQRILIDGTELKEPPLAVSPFRHPETEPQDFHYLPVRQSLLFSPGRHKITVQRKGHLFPVMGKFEVPTPIHKEPWEMKREPDMFPVVWTQWEDEETHIWKGIWSSLTEGCGSFCLLPVAYFTNPCRSSRPCWYFGPD